MDIQRIKNPSVNSLSSYSDNASETELSINETSYKCNNCNILTLENGGDNNNQLFWDNATPYCFECVREQKIPKNNINDWSHCEHCKKVIHLSKHMGCCEIKKNCLNAETFFHLTQLGYQSLCYDCGEEIIDDNSGDGDTTDCCRLCSVIQAS